MEDENLLQEPLTPNQTGYAAFQQWASSRNNQGLSSTDLDAGLPSVNPYENGGNIKNGGDSLLALLNKVKGTEDTSDFSYHTADISKRYPKNYLGIDNEELYADNQSTMQKAYNGVVKMAGTASTTFINGTAGTVYGIMQARETGKLQSFYDNDLTNYLNDINTSMEDTYAHYRTQREINGSWWEPANLFTGNFLFDNIIKNLGFSIGAVGAGFAWGGALKAVGLTGKLISSGQKLATTADTIVSEAAILPQAERLAVMNNKLNSLWNTTKGSIGAGLIKSDRAIVATFGTFGESGLEALNNSQQFRNNMIDDFTRQHGYAPDGNDLKQINEYAESIGNSTFLLNTALLTATNYIQLPKIYGSSFKAEKSELNKIALQGEKYASTLPEKGFGKLWKQGKNLISLGFNKDEAFEEGAQFAIQTGTQNYYAKKYKGQDANVLDDGILYGVKEALTTDEGLLNVAIGGLSGALQSSGFIGVKKNDETGKWKFGVGITGKIGERGLTGYGGENAVLRKEAIDALNSSMIKDKLKQAYASVKAAESIQQEREAAIRQGDILESKDLEFDYAHNFIANRLNHNAKSAIDDEINDLKQKASSDAGFLELQQEGTAAATDTKASFITRLSNLEKHAEHASKLKEALDIKYKGLINTATNKPLYTDDVLEQMVYAGSKIMDYDNRIPQLNLSLAEAGIVTLDILSDILVDGIPKDEVVAKAVEEIKKLNSINEDELLTDLRDLIEVSLRRKQYINEYKDIKENPLKYVPVKKEKAETDENLGSIMLETKNGKADFIIGKKYFLDQVVESTADGQPVYRTPTVKIVRENEDGSVQMYDVATKETFNLSPDKLLNYNLIGLEETVADPISKFLLKNRNTIFEHKNLKDKDGNVRRGRIRYNAEKKILEFYYTDLRGIERSKPVTIDMFKAQKGFKQPMIEAVEKLSPEYASSVRELLEAMLTDKAAVYRESVEARNKIIKDLYDDTRKEVEEINDKLLKNKEKIDKLSKQIEEQTLTKTGKARARISKQLQNVIDALTDTRENIMAENEILLDRKANLEYDIPYFESLIEEYKDFEGGSQNFIDSLKSDIKTLGDLYDVTNNAIDENKRMTGLIDTLLEKALSAFNQYLDKLKEANPNIPFFIEDLQERLEKVLGEEGAKYYIDNKQGITERVLQLQNDIQDFENSVNLPELTKKAEALPSELQELIAGLDKLVNQTIATNRVLDKFQDFVEEQNRLEEEEKAIATNRERKAELASTEDKTVIQNRRQGGKYEPAKKKPTNVIGRATMAPMTGKPHQVRANRFGARVDNLPQDSVFGVYVTKNNEAEYGMTGLIDNLKIDEQGNIDDSIDEDGIITLVMVNSEGIPVDEFGIQIADSKQYIEKGIYQVFPDAKLTWSAEYGGESMFRKNTDEAVEKQVREVYAKWRKSILENPGNELHSVSASFGIPEFVLDETGEPNYDAKTTVMDAGLVSEDDLEQKVVLRVPKLETEGSQGLTTYETATGKVFIQLPNALVPLPNRKHNQKEANAIFDAILQLSKFASDFTQDMKDPEPTRLLEFLKSVVYWGFPLDAQGNRKPAGYNSIFFEEDKDGKLMLTISKDGKDFVFTPIELERNKDAVLERISDIYMNVNSKLINDINREYEQIVSINEEGDVTSVIWPNYQSFLLSDKQSDGNGRMTDKKREIDDIPLTTPMRPIDGPEDVNRSGIYFYTTDNADDFTFTEKKKAQTTKKKKAKAPFVANKNTKKGSPKAQPKGKPRKKTVAPEESEVIIDGQTINTFTLPDGKKVNYGVHPNVEKMGINGIMVLEDEEDYDAVIAHIKDKNKGKDPEKLLREVLLDYILHYINSQEESTATEEEEVEEDFMAPIKVGGATKVTPKKKASLEEDDDTTDSGASDRLQQLMKKHKNDMDADEEDALREKIINENESIETEDWKEVEANIKTMLPTIPFYRVRNVLNMTNGRQAWGMFKNAAIYVYENAEVGTAYHEVFHAVWRMFTDTKEQSAILNELKEKEGTFFDRASRSDIKFSDATDLQLEEHLAEQFRDYVQEGKAPAKGKSFISRMFYDLIKFIKDFFTGKNAISNSDRLFEKITAGNFARTTPYQAEMSYANKGIIDIDNVDTTGGIFSEVVRLTDTIRHEIIENMTYMTLLEVTKNDTSLFRDPKIMKLDLYDSLREDIIRRISKDAIVIEKLYEDEKITNASRKEGLRKVSELIDEVENGWDSIITQYEDYLKGYSIEFDENDSLQINNDDLIKESDKFDATKIDAFKKANRAIKLLLSTVPYTKANGKLERSSINGAKLIPVSKVSITLLNVVSSARNTDEMIDRIRELAEADPNYKTLYKRITKKDSSEKGLALNKITTRGNVQLITALWSLLKKYNSAVKVVSVLENGEVIVKNSFLSNAAEQLKQDYLNSITTVAKAGKQLFYYSPAKKGYFINRKKLNSSNIITRKGMVDFLNQLGINFTITEINRLEHSDPIDFAKFKSAVGGIKKSLYSTGRIASFYIPTLSIGTRLYELAEVKSKLSNPEVDSTFFNISGEMTQSYIGPNASSQLFETLNQIEELSAEELSTTPQFSYLLTDTFTKGSAILKRMFTEKGKRKEDKEQTPLFTVGYVGGFENNVTGKKQPSSKLNYKDRLLQELNLNIKGWFLNLVPGDASIEHMIYMGNQFDYAGLSTGMGQIHRVFREYFFSELAVSQEKGRPFVEAKGRERTDLRFLKSILANPNESDEKMKNKLHNDIIEYANSHSPEETYAKFEKQINSAIDKFMKNNATMLGQTLDSYGLIGQDDFGRISIANTMFPSRMSEEELQKQLLVVTANYMVANIEMHKLLYSDPYQYADELKRTKSFNSPRQLIVGGKDSINQVFNSIWNKGYSKNDIGYTDFTRGFFRTVTHKDIMAEIDLPGYDVYTETDGGGIISYKAYRNFRIRAGQWTDGDERQYRYEIAWEKQDKAKKASDAGNKKLSDELYNSISYEESLLLDAKNPKLQTAFTDLKPIVSGNKADGNPWNDVVLDKFALYPLSYRLMSQINPESNVVKLYNKMQKEDIDYIIFDSGRKVGAMNSHPTYDESTGAFNENPYVSKGKNRNVINIPFEIMSVQSDVPSKEVDKVRRGTQPTKLATLDFMEAGIPTDFNPDDRFEDRYAAWYGLNDELERVTASPLYSEIKNNQSLIESIIEKGYDQLLNSLGIQDKGNRFEITDFSEAAKTLRDEILKRHVNNNINLALSSFISTNGESMLEATPAYQQIRNILYSIADKEVISSKMPGGLKVQISSALFEENRIKPNPVKIKGKTTPVFQSDVLNFYSIQEGDKEIRVCEVMVGRFFKSKLSDAELIEYLNETEEGQEILNGFAYRVPTQKQNSIDVFKIKQFLPEEFKDSVVVPSALVAKVGSDFDIDKLTMYFKNVKVDGKGYPHIVKFTADAENLNNRYYDWVLENSKRDTQKYVKWLSKSIIKEIRNNFREELNVIKSKYRGDIRFKREQLYNFYQEDIKASTGYFTDQESYIRELFNEGKKVFFSLPQEDVSDFFDLKDKLRELDIDGPQEIENYLGLALLKIETEEDSQIVDTLRDLVEIYKQELLALGARNEYVDQVQKQALAQFRENKTTSINAITTVMDNVINSVSEKYELERATNDLEVAQEIADTDSLPTLEEFSKMSIYKQNSRKAVENAYIKSLENLTKHRLNYERLIQPNSAEDMKKLSNEIARKIHGQEFDYQNVGNMLNRMFMSSLRHAFVTGKYAIGIAAVNQTNHSLNQRQLMYIDQQKLKNVSEKDLVWLADASIHFEKYNSIRTPDKGVVTTLSMVRNAERSKKFPKGQDISDIIGQFIDGYVDISKGPWIMELGATPNVASTWLFLVKIGVPINDIAYFMNQPIIRDYLKSIERAGYSYLFMDKYVQNTLAEFSPGGTADTSKLFTGRKNYKIPNTKSLEDMVGKDISELDRFQKYDQQMMLLEFLKYAKMAEQLFYVTQGTSFDTANFNDPFLIYKKHKQLEKAQNTIISDVDELLENSFLGVLQTKIVNFRNALATILKSDRKRTRTIIQKVLDPYVDMNDNDFVKLSRKAVNDFFDWAVQSKGGKNSINQDIAKILLEDEGIGNEIIDFVRSVKRNINHPLHNNHVIDIIEIQPSKLSGEGRPVNVKVKGLDNKVYDQNNIIFAFREIRDFLSGQKEDQSSLYEKLKLLAVLQSGLSTSQISFTAVLPYEDFAGVYENILNKLEELPNMEDFFNLGVFQRNNWNNDDIVPTKAAQTLPSGIYNPAMKFLPNEVKEAVSDGRIPKVVTMSTLSPEGKSDYIVYTWKQFKKGQDEAKMRQEGDFSFIQKGLFKKVYDVRDLEYIHSSSDREYFVYKAINAWGDAYRANEFYEDAQQSVINNGFIKVDEVDDVDIVRQFAKGKKSYSSKLYDATKTKITNRRTKQNLFEEKDEKNPVSQVDESASDGTIFSDINDVNVLSLQLKDDNTYLISEITNQMLTDMGYSPIEIGKFIKKYKC